MKPRVYLDVCCLNRPFDDSRQDRLRLEAEAVKAILRRIENGQLDGIARPVVHFEIAQMTDVDRMIEVGLIADRMKLSAIRPYASVRSPPPGSGAIAPTTMKKQAVDFSAQK